MEIYNYHSDLLLSLRYFFDKFIFPSDTIKGYQFNIGDRSLQIKPDPKFELPRIIINYGSNKSLWYRPYTWTKTTANNMVVPVLFNRTKNLTLELHEELFEFQINVIINCESQLSALSIEHILQSKLVLSKYFSLYSYNSFIDIDREFLISSLFDINNDDIVNLFVKYSDIKNSTNYCYSIKYSPIIRMDNIDVPISSTDQRSFSINVGLTIINQLPIYHELSTGERRYSISNKTFTYKDILIPGNLPLINIEFKKNNISYKTATVSEFDEDTKLFTSPFFINNNIHIISGEVKYIEYSGVFKTVIDNKLIISNCLLTKELKTNKYSAILSTPLIGKITNINILNINTFEFEGLFNSISKSNYRITGTLDVKKYNNIISNYNISCEYEFDNYNISYTSIGSLDIYFNDINSKLIKLNIEKTNFKKVYFRYNFVLYEYIIPEFFIDKNGTFILPIKFDDINFKIYGNINSTEMTIRYYTESINFELFYLVCDFEFKSEVGHGARHIDSINVNLHQSDSVILNSDYLFFYNENSSKFDTNRILYRSLVLSYSDFESIFKFNDSNVNITISLDGSFDYNKLISSDEIYWLFYIGYDGFKNRTYDSLSDEISILERTDSDLPNVLKFECTRKIYDIYFSYFDIDNPIIFQLYKIKNR